MTTIEVVVGKEDQFPPRIKDYYDLRDEDVSFVETTYMRIYSFPCKATHKDLIFLQGLEGILNFAWSVPRFTTFDNDELPEELR